MSAHRGLKVAVLAGGVGEERAISLQSGECVTQALTGAGVNAICADITPDDMSILDKSGIDAFFLALHGRFGEDGQLQKILEEKGLVYTGSGPEASRLAFDKMLSKLAFGKAGVSTSPAVLFDPALDMGTLEKQVSKLGEKFVVKPLRQGSSVGVSIVSGAANAIEAAGKCHNSFGDCMIEKFIPGRELTVGVLCERALPIIEIRPKEGFFDYQAKYLDDSTEYLFDTIDDEALVTKINTAAMACFRALGCRHVARVDFILTEQGEPIALEVNNIPGMTTHSCVPKAAARIGMSMGQLCVRIIDAAMQGRKSSNTRLRSITNI